MSLKKAGLYVVLMGFAGSSLAMEGNDELPVIRLDPQNLAVSYNQVLQVAGGFQPRELQVIQQAIAQHFDVRDPAVQKYVEARRADLACISSVAVQRREMCQDLEDKNCVIEECLKRQKEIQGEMGEVNLSLEAKRANLKKCEELFAADDKVLDKQLADGVAGFMAPLLKLKRIFLENGIGRAAVSGGRAVVPSSCAIAIAYSAFDSCSETALQCVQHFTGVSPYLTAGIGVSGYVALEMLHRSGEEVLKIINQKAARKKAFDDEEKAIKEALDKIERMQKELNDEQAEKLATNERVNAERQRLAQAKDELDGRIAQAIGARLVEMGHRNVEILNEALLEDQTSPFVHKTIVKTLQNIFDGTIVNIGLALNFADAPLLLADGADKKVSEVKLLEDDKK